MRLRFLIVYIYNQVERVLVLASRRWYVKIYHKYGVICALSGLATTQRGQSLDPMSHHANA